MDSSSDSPEESATGLRLGSLLSGRYRILKLLGEGGMGAVYQAEHVHMKKLVALKVLHREMTNLPEVMARFEREAVAVGRIEHPHVAAATDFGHLEDGTYYLALEFVQGVSLGHALKEHGPMPAERALSIARQIADALAAAHAVGVVHRDLKPDNVMLLSRGSGQGDFVKVLDFGVAKIQLEAAGAEHKLTQFGSVVGTPEYMSPEQARGVEVDARSDLYSLGIILYETLSGATPFSHDDLVVTMTRQITMDPPALPASVPAMASRLTMRLLQKDPAQRIQTAAEVCHRIDLALSTGAASTAPAPPRKSLDPGPRALSRSGFWERLSAPLRRRGSHARPGLGRRRFWVLGGLGALCLGLGFALALVGLRSATSGPPSSGSGPRGLLPELLSPGPDVGALAARAETGDPAALDELTRLPKERLGRDATRALCHGNRVRGRWDLFLEEYSKAVTRLPELAADPTLLADLREAADQDKTVASRALDLAAGSLGAAGADLLYDVWDRNEAGKRSDAARRAHDLLDDPRVQSSLAPPLRICLDLHAALKVGRCSSIKELLPVATRVADERSLTLLNRLAQRRGCGLLGVFDCYPCLRSSGDLVRALRAARARQRPGFAAVSPDPAPSGSR